MEHAKEGTMEAGLIDVLLGHFLDGQTVAEEDPAHVKLRSIIDNLSRLFNTRRGSIAHVPDYGLPDISQVYRDLPYSIDGLRTAIKQVVEKYEPRLRRIRVEQQKDKEEEYEMRVSFIVTGELLSGQKVQFQTTFKSNDLAEVRQWRRAS
jgi:type VI secretion system protein